MTFGNRDSHYFRMLMSQKDAQCAQYQHVSVMESLPFSSNHDDGV